MYKNFEDIPKAYNPVETEDKWYRYWEEKKIFHSEVDESKPPYTIVIPPPNVTGMLHLGHILNNTLQDIYIRYKRMKGFNTCWVPGTDHASIATETKVVNLLKEQGINKYDIGRKEFLKHCWDWTEKYGGIIYKQLRKLGVSCDWDRQRFTMDDQYYPKVIEAFVDLYKKGFIYRGYRMVNWCPASKSAISDEEVIYKTINGKLWHLKYPVIDGGDHIISHVIVATTRPETMLGDSAVAVNPNDERYKNIIGKKILLPICEREIPIIADEYVDMEFGTGVVKVTPAHDINDFEMGERHKLEVRNIFNDDATTNGNVPHGFQNLDRYVARKKVIARFEELGLLDKVEEYTNKVGYSQRGDVPIEPYLSEQWFMKMDELAKPALEVIQNNQINFHPAHWTKTYEHWMTNIRDWCISRQLWWGHRIPVWYHKETNEIYCDVNPPEDIENWKQDEDVLDTWASSWLWAQDVFETKEEQNYYYPTDLLVTAPDIIFFWVARMIMAGMQFMNDIPFKDVYFTSILRDDLGRKMSKSLGNSPDPIDVIKEYGADALRFTVTYIAPLGQDVLFSTDKCEIGRNFANKIWNAARFLMMNAQNIPVNQDLKDKHIDFTDKWIISRFQSTVNQIDNALDNFEVNNATKMIYAYVWNDFCDWYIELIKNRLYSEDEEIKSAVLTRALALFEDMLKIVHPFMPFVTEEIWHLLENRNVGESISTTGYPKYDETLIDKKSETGIEFLQNLITAIRNIRGEMNIPPSRKLDIHIKTEDLTDAQKIYIKSLAKVNEITAAPDLNKPKFSASAVAKGCDIFIPLEGIIDLDVEKKRIEKEINRIEGLLTGVTKKLSNENFVNKAPQDVVEKEKMKKSDWESSLEKLRTIFQDLDA
ncbi:MAG: valine--tRNA ligase [Melioribacteraceae bacterium]|nr:valine--tRNA ligase [Melioribacteraceae bacterium]MCF8353831.1 valine--tRNA ligase [Melioribacteraceae bacterium]MCF8393667.1 valine--tRNA ligase [Melioribacteraceae bacterium]MCF8419477.1 valine--tRNA ligase [Melioribacteraceae bacterium]